jgi:regulator of replication initiation timing
MSEKKPNAFPCSLCEQKQAEIERLCNIVATQEDALKEFHAEIERLQETAQVMWDEWTYLKARNEKLEKVLEHAKHLLAGGDKLVWHEPVYHLEKALAALENDDE